MKKPLPRPISFQWDEGNNEKNKIKHKVEIKECEYIFFNKPYILRDKRHSDKEERYMAFGETEPGRLLLVVFTIRNEYIRVISARDQNKKERLFYSDYRKKLSI